MLLERTHSAVHTRTSARTRHRPSCSHSPHFYRHSDKNEGRRNRPCKCRGDAMAPKNCRHVTQALRLADFRRALRAHDAFACQVRQCRLSLSLGILRALLRIFCEPRACMTHSVHPSIHSSCPLVFSRAHCQRPSSRAAGAKRAREALAVALQPL